MHFPSSSISSWTRFYRANFINTLSGFKSASLVGTTHPSGIYNLAIFSNIVHIGADPALVGIVNRPREAAPHTLSNIENSGIYTINHIHQNIIKAAHQTSAKYPETISEFDAVGLTPLLENGITAPFVKESMVRYALKLREIIPITLNNTFFIIGEITDVFIENPNEILNEDGFIHIEKAGSITSLGIDGYYQTEVIERFPYAKP
jgi:flavin reductase (DIM6/NTAB) family NADH-FMN oxidoreductase RutF